MIIKSKKEIITLDIFTFDCNGCEKCIKNCHENVLKIIDNGYCRYAIVQHIDNCTGCGKCLVACKTNAMRLIIREYL